MSDYIPDSWIDDGCREVRRLLAAGRSDLAADVAGFIERRALPDLHRERARVEEWRKRTRKHNSCQAAGCCRWTMGGYTRWCEDHQPAGD